MKMIESKEKACKKALYPEKRRWTHDPAKLFLILGAVFLALSISGLMVNVENRWWTTILARSAPFPLVFGSLILTVRAATKKKK